MSEAKPYAFVISLSDGSQEVVLAPLTDNHDMDGCDVARTLFAADDFAAVTAERDALLADKAQRELRRKELMTDPESGFLLDHEDVADLLHDRLELIAERDALRDENNAFKSHLGTSFTKLVMKKIKEKNK